ncbi:hypothetical protein, partial [Desulfonatronospira sp.]|uniref:hypothetical protein n=1 Tax=Desulfonatronospira sp. TaxID=1962951 RepID=UPI0025C3F712
SGLFGASSGYPLQDALSTTGHRGRPPGTGTGYGHRGQALLPTSNRKTARLTGGKRASPLTA